MPIYQVEARIVVDILIRVKADSKDEIEGEVLTACGSQVTLTGNGSEYNYVESVNSAEIHGVETIDRDD